MYHQAPPHLAFCTLGKNHETKQRQHKEIRERHAHDIKQTNTKQTDRTHPTHKESKKQDIHKHYLSNSKHESNSNMLKR